jgi:predicted Zn-dependent protease
VTDGPTAFSKELSADAHEAVRLVAGLVRRGVEGEAFRERRRITSFSANESGLLAPSVVEERGTAVRLREGSRLLLVARAGDDPESLRETVREAARRGGGAPFFKGARLAPRGAARSAAPAGDEEALAAAFAAALARGVPDPRGLSLSLRLARVQSARVVVTPRALLPCGETVRILVTGSVGRAGMRRGFAFQSARPLSEAALALASFLQAALRPVTRLGPPEGETDIVFSPQAAAVFWHEVVGHPLEADGTAGGSVLARVPGALVAPASYSVHDDPRRADLPGGYPVDDEGVPARPVPLLLEGRVAGTLTDRRSAAGASNGHGRTSDWRRPPAARMSNLVVAAGRAPLGELFERCSRGLYVKEVSSGSADPESGRFVLFVESAETIRRGKLHGPVGPCVVTGELLRALEGLDPERGAEALPADGLGLCARRGDALAVGGETPAILVRGLWARGGST